MHETTVKQIFILQYLKLHVFIIYGLKDTLNKMPPNIYTNTYSKKKSTEINKPFYLKCL